MIIQMKKYFCFKLSTSNVYFLTVTCNTHSIIITTLLKKKKKGKKNSIVFKRGEGEAHLCFYLLVHRKII